MAEADSGLIAAFEKLPSFQGVTWRGAEGALAGGIRLPAPLPTSRDPRIASGNFACAYLWAIISCAGRDIAPISADPSAQEITLLPGSVITPASATLNIDGVQVQVILEVREGVPVAPTPSEDDLASLVRAARAEEPATIRQPGRFG